MTGDDESAGADKLSFSDAPGTILIVDDLPANRNALRKLLETPHRKIIEADSGFEALQTLLTTDVSLVLLDIEMPEMDGFETANLIRASERIRHVPIIFQSAHGTDERALQGYSMGAVDFIQKPIIPAILQARVDVFLTLVQRTAELTAKAQALRAAEARTRSILENATDGVIIIDELGRIQSFNRAAERMFGYPESRVIGRSAETLMVDPDSDAAALTPAHIARSIGITLELTGIRSNSSTFPVGVSVSESGDQQEQLVVLTVRDLTEAKHAEDRLMRLAQYDHLTGLANRVTLEERVSRCLAHARRYEGYGVLLYLDIDGFKTVNDAFGHRTGDMLLQETSRRLDDATRDADVIARLGGDEFCVLLDHLNEPSDAAIVADRIVSSLAEPFVLDGKVISSSASIGYTTIAPDDSVGSIILRADSAMYAAKRAGGGQAISADDDSDSFLEISSRLSDALSNREYEFTFDPVIELSTGSVTAVEAGFHWRASGAQLVPLESIRRAAEASGLIQRIAHLAIQECMEFLSNDSEGRSVQVNLSIAELCSSEVIEAIASQLRERKLDPARFMVCVNGEALQFDPAASARALHSVRSTGAQVVLDQFGLTHSSINTLTNGSLNAVKIDSWLVNSRSASASDRAVLRAITDIAHSAGLDVIATGVDSRESYRPVVEAMCDYAQGEYFALKNGATQSVPVQATINEDNHSLTNSDS